MKESYLPKLGIGLTIIKNFKVNTSSTMYSYTKVKDSFLKVQKLEKWEKNKKIKVKQTKSFNYKTYESFLS